MNSNPRLILLVLLLSAPGLHAGTHTVGIIPFENVGKNPELDWLSVGIAETITSNMTVTEVLTKFTLQ